MINKYKNNLQRLMNDDNLVALTVDVSPTVFIDDQAKLHDELDEGIREVSELYWIYLNNRETRKERTLVRTKFDCNTCKRAIENGNIIFIDRNLNKYTAWDGVKGRNKRDKHTARVLSEYLKSRPIINKLYSDRKTFKFGVDENVSETYEMVFEHFVTEVKEKYRYNFVSEARQKTIEYYNDLKDVFERASLEDFESIQNYISISNDSHIKKLELVKEMFIKYHKTENKELWLWFNLSKIFNYYDNSSNKKFSNGVIGQMVVAMIEDKTLNEVVGLYNSMTNINTANTSSRPASVNAVKNLDNDLKKLGYKKDDFLTGTIANISEIPAVWQSGHNELNKEDELLNSMMKSARRGKKRKTVLKKSKSNGIEIGMSNFVKNILPNASKMEMNVGGVKHHRAVFTKQTHGDNNIFGHGNKYGFMYISGKTNPILERVKGAGGNIETPYGFSLSWEGDDDLDIGICHSKKIWDNVCAINNFGNPYKSEFVYYGQKSLPEFGIELDIDANANSIMKKPVENISMEKIVDGYYYIVVNNYNERKGNSGFSLNIRNEGHNRIYNFPTKLADGKICHIMWHVKNGEIIEEEIDSRLIPIDGNNGIADFKIVDKVSISPNFWNGEHGNAHYFFHVDGLKWDKDKKVKFLHNELIHPKLRKLRRVLQSLGDQNEAYIKDDPANNVWLGFDTNKEKTLQLKVKGRNGVTKLYSVNINQ